MASYKLRINFDKNIRMDNLCKADDLRPVFENIYFDNGNMISTDSHVLVVNKISECSSFQPEQIELLNGKFIHSKDYAELIKSDIVTIKADGFYIKNGTREKVIYFNKCDYKFPNYEALFNNKSEETSCIGVDLTLINKLQSALPYKRSCKLTFNGKNNAIYVSSIDSEYQSKGLIMPKTIEN